MLWVFREGMAERALKSRNRRICKSLHTSRCVSQAQFPELHRLAPFVAFPTSSKVHLRGPCDIARPKANRASSQEVFQPIIFKLTYSHDLLVTSGTPKRDLTTLLVT